MSVDEERRKNAKESWEPVDPEEIPPAMDKLPEGAHRTPPRGYPQDRSAYGIPDWYALPLDTPEHARSAASRFPQMDVYRELSEEEQRVVWRRIVDAERKFGIEPGEEVLSRAGYSA